MAIWKKVTSWYGVRGSGHEKCPILHGVFSNLLLKKAYNALFGVEKDDIDV
jgi:hypothetical protein